MLDTLVGASTPDQARTGELSQERLKELYRAAEVRANEAEVRLSKLSREIQHVKDKASASVRDIQRLAYQDDLTGLANGHLIKEHLESLAGRRSVDRQAVLLVIDLDHFQTINTVFGHERGDELLTRVGERLAGLTGQGMAVGRLAEDEFVVVASDIPVRESERRAQQLAETVRGLLGAPFQVQGQKLELTASQGGTCLPESTSAGRDALHQARSALSLAKARGRNQFLYYDPELHRERQRDATLELQLKYARQAGEFFVEYLPFVQIESATEMGGRGRVVGVEALLRWRHRVEGVLWPHQFLPVAVRTGEIVAIGEEMMHTVCRQQQQWRAQGLDLFINLNLAGRQLLEPDLPARLHAITQDCGLSVSRLTLEFREDWAATGQEMVDSVLAELAAGGFALSLDRFGEGATTLERLNQVHQLKLSRGLVNGRSDLCDRAISLAGCFGLSCIGVGVESAATASYLNSRGCQLVQGFLFSQALEPRAVESLVQTPLKWGSKG